MSRIRQLSLSDLGGYLDGTFPLGTAEPVLAALRLKLVTEGLRPHGVGKHRAWALGFCALCRGYMQYSCRFPPRVDVA